jgi:hypothetical protein
MNSNAIFFSITAASRVHAGSAAAGSPGLALNGHMSLGCDASFSKNHLSPESSLT